MRQNITELSVRQAQYQQQRIDQAHRRYLGAIKSFAQVRRLQLPAVQVNIRQQNNGGK